MVREPVKERVLLKECGDTKYQDVVFLGSIQLSSSSALLARVQDECVRSDRQDWKSTWRTLAKQRGSPGHISHKDHFPYRPVQGNEVAQRLLVIGRVRGGCRGVAHQSDSLLDPGEIRLSLRRRRSGLIMCDFQFDVEIIVISSCKSLVFLNIRFRTVNEAMRFLQRGATSKWTKITTQYPETRYPIPQASIFPP